jgi:hypothetical protein
VPDHGAIVQELRGSGKMASLKIRVDGERVAYSVSGTAGMTPSITFSCVGSGLETSHTVMVPSDPDVVWVNV